MERSQTEIDTMIQKLKDEKKRLPQFSVFGDDNWASTDLMIEVLEGKYTTSDDIYDVEDEVGHEASSSMLSALEWLDGEVNDDELI